MSKSARSAMTVVALACVVSCFETTAVQKSTPTTSAYDFVGEWHLEADDQDTYHFAVGGDVWRKDRRERNILWRFTSGGQIVIETYKSSGQEKLASGELESDVLLLRSVRNVGSDAERYVRIGKAASPPLPAYPYIGKYHARLQEGEDWVEFSVDVLVDGQWSVRAVGSSAGTLEEWELVPWSTWTLYEQYSDLWLPGKQRQVSIFTNDGWRSVWLERGEHHPSEVSTKSKSATKLKRLSALPTLEEPVANPDGEAPVNMTREQCEQLKGQGYVEGCSHIK